MFLIIDLIVITTLFYSIKKPPNWRFLLAPPVGFEPTTFSLTASRSTVELQGNTYEYIKKYSFFQGSLFKRQILEGNDNKNGKSNKSGKPMRNF